MKKSIFYLLLISTLFWSQSGFAQSQIAIDQGLRFIQSQQSNWNLSISDLKDLTVSDIYTDDHNGVTHIYYVQQFQGIPIYNAITSVHIAPNGQIYDSPSRFYANIKSKVNATKPKIDALQALTLLLNHYEVNNAILPNPKLRSNANKTYFEKTNFTISDIPVKLIYVPMPDGSLKLAWDLTMDLIDRPDVWSTRVDALTGVVIDQQNLTISCSFGNHSKNSTAKHDCESHSSAILDNNNKLLVKPSASVYNVIPFPVESPLHGSRKLVSDPAILSASPYGWHDVNAQAGAEFTITRGNNVYAYLDKDANNTPDPTTADGGAGLNFDFPFNTNDEPNTYAKAALTNLFYVNNMVHDVLYGFGFNEKSGSFQVNNYGKGGIGNDAVLAEAQDGSGSNNANFATPSDGSSGRMQMYLWTASLSEVQIVAPKALEGYLSANRAAFGVAPTSTPITAKVVWSDDGTFASARKGCKDAQKTANCKGNIVAVDRGDCDFSEKAYFAQKAGAVALLIFGFSEENIAPGAGNLAANVTIPVYYLRKSVVDKFRDSVGINLTITIQKPVDNTAGPDSLDGDFDNGIIAHEYGHGISNRLTGGPAQSNCLGNAEQMGEGWSDFMSLILTAKPGDKKTDVKGIGNYATSGPLDGIGIRRRPYTTNMKVNEFTYKDIDTEVHNLGEVWTVMLWDLYWALCDKYGYDPDFNNKTAGNNICIQLVMDGMKLQPCSPGFVDGRNAILKADSINNNKANTCLIWEVFARRGLGYYAKQGSSNFVGDEVEDFESLPICVNDLKIYKKADFLVKAGSNISYTLEIRNLRDAVANNVVLEDEIPNGCSYVNGSASITPTSVSSDKVRWEFASMKELESKTITYKLNTSSSNFSNTIWYDNLESSNVEDLYDNSGVRKGNGVWILGPGFGVDNSNCWLAESSGTEARDYNINNIAPIKLTGNNPAFLFFQKFNTQKAIDGGFIELSNDGLFWELLPESDYLLNGVNSNLNYSTFAIPLLKGFSGYTSEFIPTVFDLSKHANKDLYVRFRFGNDATIESTNPGLKGWSIDNLEAINPVFYNGQACVTSALGDHNCISLPGKGTLVDSKKVVSTQDQNKTESDLLVYPNPAQSEFTVLVPNDFELQKINIHSATGTLLKTINLDHQNQSVVKCSAKDLAKGVILIEAIGSQKILTSKLILK